MAVVKHVETLGQTSSSEEAIARVAERVKQGGHNIPEAVIRRLVGTGKIKFERLYAPCVDAWAIYDSAGSEPVPLDWSENP